MTNVLVKILISKSWLFERTVAMRVQLINRKKKTNKRKKRISIHSESDPETELPMAQAQTRSPCVCTKFYVMLWTFPSNGFFPKGQLLRDPRRKESKRVPTNGIPAYELGYYPNCLHGDVKNECEYNYSHSNDLVTKAQKS